MYFFMQYYVSCIKTLPERDRKGVEEKGMTGSVGAGRASDIFYFLIDF